MKKTNTILVAVCMAASFSALSTEWNFHSSGFNQDGNVTITQESGEIRSIDNQSSVFSSASAPTFINMQATSIGAPIPFEPRTRSFNVLGNDGDRMANAHYSFNYVATQTLTEKCLMRSMNVSIRSQRGANYDFKGHGIALNGAVMYVPVASDNYLWGSSNSSGNISKNHVETQFIPDEWGVFKVIQRQSGYTTVLLFDTPLLIETVKLGMRITSADPWMRYTVSYNCMAEF